MNRTASAIWTGGLKGGKGLLSTQSGVLNQTPYGFATRFESGPGTNPEELIAAAHAGCFTMALAAQLEKDGRTAERLETSATVTLAKVDGDYSITAVHLDLVARIPGTDPATFAKIAQVAKEACPVSKLLAAEITLSARLER